jgi:hypothetical protein
MEKRLDSLIQEQACFFFLKCFFYFKVLFMFLNCFNTLVSKIIFKKYKKYYFNIFMNKIYF